MALKATSICTPLGQDASLSQVIPLQFVIVPQQFAVTYLLSWVQKSLWELIGLAQERNTVSLAKTIHGIKFNILYYTITQLQTKFATSKYKIHTKTLLITINSLMISKNQTHRITDKISNTQTSI